MNRPGKIVCVGRNYAAHAAELGNTVPTDPLLFLKPPSAVIGDGDAIVLPEQSGRVEHEAEIGIVIGATLCRVDERQATAGMAGVTCVNDVTARDLQRRDNQWTRAKGFDTFCPVGPRVIPLASLPPLDGLEVIGSVNGVERQHGYTRDLAFSIPFLVSYISHIMTLEKGDLIATGTPSGVGPLEPGDEVVVRIPGVGALTNPVRRR